MTENSFSRSRDALKLYSWNHGFILIFCDQISLDFFVRFKVPSDTFLMKWDEIKGHIKSVHGSKAFQQSQVLAKLGDEIEPILLLLQMLPDVPKGSKSSKKRLTFDESIESFIVFSPVIHLKKVFKMIWTVLNRFSMIDLGIYMNYVQMLTISRLNFYSSPTKQ